MLMRIKLVIIPKKITAIVNAVKFSMKFADEDLEYNIKYAEILNKKKGSNQVNKTILK